jgi:hypothetical protein
MKRTNWSECRARLKNRVLKGSALTEGQKAILKSAVKLLEESQIAEDCAKLLRIDEENRQAKLN